MCFEDIERMVFYFEKLKKNEWKMKINCFRLIFVFLFSLPFWYIVFSASFFFSFSHQTPKLMFPETKAEKKNETFLIIMGM